MIKSSKQAQAPAEAFSRAPLLPAMNASKTAAVENARDRTSDFDYAEMLQAARTTEY